MTSVDDAAFAVAAGADAIGLVFYPPSPRHVSIAVAREICASLPALVSVVALTVDMPAAELDTLLAQVPVDLLQFHGDETPAVCRAAGKPYIKALRMAGDIDVETQMARYSGAKGILLDAYRKGVPGGTGETFDWQRIPSQRRADIILAGGLTAANVASAVTRVRPYAVDVSGGVESAPGIKDRDKIEAFIQQVAAADREIAGGN